MNFLKKMLLTAAAVLGVATTTSISVSADQTLYFGTQNATTKSELMNDSTDNLYQGPDYLNKELEDLKNSGNPTSFAIGNMSFTDSEINTLIQQGRLYNDAGKQVISSGSFELKALPKSNPTINNKKTLPATGSVNEAGLTVAGLAMVIATLGFAARCKF